VTSVTYRPSLKTRQRLEQIGEDLSTASPMKLLARMRLEGFSDRAISEKMEIPTKTVMRLLDGKNVPRKPITVMAGVANRRPWKPEDHERRRSAIREAVLVARQVKMWDADTPLSVYCEREFGISSRGREYKRICYAISRGMSVRDAVTFAMRLDGWKDLLPRRKRDDSGKFTVRREPVADERQAGIVG